MKTFLVIYLLLLGIVAQAEDLSQFRTFQMNNLGKPGFECFGSVGDLLGKFPKKNGRCDFTRSEFQPLKKTATFEKNGRLFYQLEGISGTSADSVWAAVTPSGRLAIRQKSNGQGFQINPEKGLEKYDLNQAQHEVYRDLPEKGQSTTLPSLNDEFEIQKLMKKAKESQGAYEGALENQGETRGSDWAKDRFKKLNEFKEDIKKLEKAGVSAETIKDKLRWDGNRLITEGELKKEQDTKYALLAENYRLTEEQARINKEAADKAEAARAAAVKQLTEQSKQTQAEEAKQPCSLKSDCETLQSPECFSQLMQKTGACTSSCSAEDCSTQYRVFMEGAIAALLINATDAGRKLNSAIAAKKSCEIQNELQSELDNQRDTFDTAVKDRLGNPSGYFPSLKDKRLSCIPRTLPKGKFYSQLFAPVAEVNGKVSGCKSVAKPGKPIDSKDSKKPAAG